MAVKGSRGEPGAVFLSASLPDPKRDRRYFDTADLIGIREAVRALATVVLPRTRLVFGGHPAITPLVRMVAEVVGKADRVRVFQSAYFAGQLPADNQAFQEVVLVPAVDGDREASLLRMREEMMMSERFAAGVFIGGMKGVEEELALFAGRQPDALVLPVASTGAAAKMLFDQGKGPSDPAKRDALANDTVYGALFASLLGYV